MSNLDMFLYMIGGCAISFAIIAGLNGSWGDCFMDSIVALTGFGAAIFLEDRKK